MGRVSSGNLSALSGLQGVLGKTERLHSVRTLIKGDKALEQKLDRATGKKLKEFPRAVGSVRH